MESFSDGKMTGFGREEVHDQTINGITLLSLSPFSTKLVFCIVLTLRDGGGGGGGGGGGTTCV